MEIKPNTILECGEITFRVIEKIKNDTVFSETGVKLCNLKDYGMVGYRCENVATNEIMVVPIHKSLERKMAKGKKEK